MAFTHPLLKFDLKSESGMALLLFSHYCNTTLDID